jgi:2-polyprenyl-3-methyl-5-hydroxy-6-metoxy-1,4-benzoquinol methylase
VLPWDHNAYYHPRLLNLVPNGAERVLEVGCGAGQLATRLATRAKHVDAIDSDVRMIDMARECAPSNVTYSAGDVMTAPLEPDSYDAVVSLSVLHHVPLTVALERFAAALRPGGVLAAVGVPKRDLPRELLVEAAATASHHALALALTATGYRGRPQLRRSTYHAAMVIRQPQLTTRQVRQQAATVLPGARVDRLLLWRYLLVWTKPT